jgi:hypothetical protein
LQGRIIQLEKDKENLQSEVSKVKFAQENVGSRKENQRHEVQETGTVTSHGPPITETATIEGDR